MLSSHPHEAMVAPYAPPSLLVVDRQCKQQGAAEVAPSCPRCDSPNTKFCYYNNYSLSQPRYFCKGCRRYWTKGGSLRNVPVGGGCRKNRRGKSSVRSAADSISGGRDGAFGHRFPAPLRPDMVLEGMVSNPANPSQLALHDVPTAAGGSGIDLAMLYSKFLSNKPAQGSAVAVTPELSAAEHVAAEAFETFSASSDLSPGVLAPSQLDASHYGFGGWSAGPVSSNDPTSTSTTTATTVLCSTDASGAAPGGELNFAMFQSCFDSLGLPAVEGAAGSLSPWCSIVPSLSAWEEPRYDSLDSFPDDAMSLHQGMLLAADHDWSSDCQGLEALYMP